MKSVICLVVLCIVISIFPALAEVDLSEMSFDALVKLRDQIDYAIWNSQEWQEVTVPQGIYEVGVDIPAGHWTIKPLDGKMAHLRWGKALDEYMMLDRVIVYEFVYSPIHRNYEEGEDVPFVNWELIDGTYIEIEDGSAVFTPYAGKLSLAFK